MFKEIKDTIANDWTLLIDLLESLDCHDIDKTHSKEIRCALPDSKNNTSVRIKKNSYMTVDIFSRHDFDDFEINDIFSLVQYIRDCKLEDSKKYICSVIGLEYNNEANEYYKSPTVKEVKRFKKKESKVYAHEVLDESELNKYEDFVVDDWVKEGIDAQTQKLFGVRRSQKYERWVIPIRNEFGNLITTKGRTYVKDFGLKGIYKYVYYPKFGFNDILYGYHLTKDSITQKDTVVVVEAEKSVMKAWSMGEKNFVASGKAGLNGYQVKRIISMPCKSVVLAYDKDIGMDIIDKDINALKYYKDVYYIWDDEDLLGEKDSPVDCGLWTWITLHDKKRRA